MPCNPIPYPCSECGSVRMVRPVFIRLGRRKICHTCSSKIRPSFLTHKSGPGNPHWKGGRTKTNKGYVYVLIPSHPRSRKGLGYVLEHIVVAEQMIGRKLFDDEVVHHVNGVKDDNRPENLEVMTRSEHTRHHKSGG